MVGGAISAGSDFPNPYRTEKIRPIPTSITTTSIATSMGIFMALSLQNLPDQSRRISSVAAQGNQVGNKASYENLLPESATRPLSISLPT
jgi:hypothetical protein